VELNPEFARAYAALAVLYWKAIQYATPELRQGLGVTNRRELVAVTINTTGKSPMKKQLKLCLSCS
jgi:hypothetical protein